MSALQVPSTQDCAGLAKAFRAYVEIQRDQILPLLNDVVSKVDAKAGKLDILSKLEIIADLKKCSDAEQPARQRFIDAAKEFDRAK